MANYSVTEALKEARDIILEESSEIVDDTRLLKYANFTKDDIGKRVPAKEFINTAPVNFVGGVGSLPTDFVAAISARDNMIVGQGNAFDYYSNTDYGAGNFDYGFTSQGGALNVYPTTTGLLYVRYYKKLADMSLNGDMSVLPDYLHELIIPGIVWRALRILQEENRSQYYRTQYETDLAIKAGANNQIEQSGQQDGQLFTPLQIL